VLQTLGVTIQLLKLVLFAQLAAVFGSSGAQSALWQVLPLLALICLYLAYVRVFVPMAHLADAVAEVSALQCTGGRCIACTLAREQHSSCQKVPRLLKGGARQCWWHCAGDIAMCGRPCALSPLSFSYAPTPHSNLLMQAISCACDLGTLVCSVVVASLPSTAINTL
jgi:hypothetical protein